MSISSVKAWCKAAIEGVEGYAHVYDHLRTIQNPNELEEDLGTEEIDENQVRTKGWYITVGRVASEDLTQFDAFTTYDLRVLCYWSLYSRGASAAAFEAHVEAVVAALQQDLSPDSIPNIYDVGNAATDYDLVEFPREGGRLHHRAIVTVSVRTTEAVRT
jgi:hypothetical protein